MISAKSPVLWGALTAIFFGSNTALADFEWGSPCDDGSGEFEQYVVQGGIVEIKEDSGRHGRYRRPALQPAGC